MTADELMIADELIIVEELAMAEELIKAEELIIADEIGTAEELIVTEELTTTEELIMDEDDEAAAVEVLLLAGPGETRDEDEDELVLEEVDAGLEVELLTDDITALLGAAPARRIAALVPGLLTRCPGFGLG